MSFDWRQYLNLSRFLAGELHVQYSEDASLRSAVSRAYYAAFCHARGYAQQKNGFRPRYDWTDHQSLRDHFGRDTRLKGLASRLDELRKWRNNCDYKDVVANLPHIARSAIGHAETILRNLP